MTVNKQKGFSKLLELTLEELLDIFLGVFTVFYIKGGNFLKG